MVELEGGEGVINKRAMSNPFIRATASRLNQVGGGKKFGMGGTIPKYAGGGIMQSVEDGVFGNLRGFLAEELGALKVYNTVTDTTDRQNEIDNTLAEAEI